MREKVIYVVAAVLIIFIIGITVFFNTPTGRGIINTYFYNMQKVDDSTNYYTMKEVEDTCRAMIASYNTDRLTYEQYRDSDSEEKQSWAEQAKMRANKTASSYNNYILKNSYVWSGNIPEDIKEELEYIE